MMTLPRDPYTVIDWNPGQEQKELALPGYQVGSELAIHMDEISREHFGLLYELLSICTFVVSLLTFLQLLFNVL